MSSYVIVCRPVEGFSCARGTLPRSLASKLRVGKQTINASQVRERPAHDPLLAPGVVQRDQPHARGSASSGLILHHGPLGQARARDPALVKLALGVERRPAPDGSLGGDEVEHRGSVNVNACGVGMGCGEKVGEGECRVREAFVESGIGSACLQAGSAALVFGSPLCQLPRGLL